MTKVLIIIGVVFSLVACEPSIQDKPVQVGQGAKASSERVSIEALREKAIAESGAEESLRFERVLEESVDLYSYTSDDLNVFTMVNRPDGEAPEKGFPVVVFGHGFHPDPPKYGFSNATGEDSRPGDYYRGIPDAYAARGFLTITPDYRGHNVSQGAEFTKTSYLASSYYARDVISLLNQIVSLKEVDLDRIYYMGHSMGADVGLKVLLATDVIKAASMWSGVLASTSEQVVFYQKWSLESDSSLDAGGFATMHEKIKSLYSELAPGVSFEDVDPTSHIEKINKPLIIHHGLRDKGASYMWSERFSVQLQRLDKKAEFYFYDTADHLFSGEMRELAVQRDIEFFNRY